MFALLFERDPCVYHNARWRRQRIRTCPLRAEPPDGFRVYDPTVVTDHTQPTAGDMKVKATTVKKDERTGKWKVRAARRALRLQNPVCVVSRDARDPDAPCSFLPHSP
eukprot:862579-Prorocentrum_minimum.AAC.1